MMLQVYCVFDVRNCYVARIVEFEIGSNSISEAEKEKRMKEEEKEDWRGHNHRGRREGRRRKEKGEGLGRRQWCCDEGEGLGGIGGDGGGATTKRRGSTDGRSGGALSSLHSLFTSSFSSSLFFLSSLPLSPLLDHPKRPKRHSSQFQAKIFELWLIFL
ncbi:unnamed protein product [Camellia sinensis]